MNSTSKILLVLVIVLTVSIGWLIFDKLQQRSENAKISKQLVEIKSEKSIIEGELETMYTQYESLKTDNKDLKALLSKYEELGENDRV